MSTSYPELARPKCRSGNQESGRELGRQRRGVVSERGYSSIVESGCSARRTEIQGEGGRGVLHRPAGAAQRRYEALRAYFVDEHARRRGRRPVRVLHRQRPPDGHAAAQGQAEPVHRGPARPERPAQGHRDAAGPGAGAARRRALVTEIAAALTAEGMPVSAQTVWQILDAEGHAAAAPPRRGPPRPAGQAGPGQGRRAARLAGRAVRRWRAITPGCCCCSPPSASSGLHDLVRAAGYPSTRALSSWQSTGTLLLAKCARKPRVPHAGTLADDEGLAFTLGLTALPKATHLGTYSWRVRRDSNRALLSGLVTALRPLGLATGEAGFNCDFHAIRHHGDQAVLEKHYVAPPLPAHPRRAHLLRPGPRLHRDGLRQRRHHQGRAGRRDHRLRRLLAAGHRQPTPACWSSTPS